MKEKKIKVSTEDLKNVAETLLYPLISRYVETKKENGVIKDPKSIEIIEALDYDVKNTKLFPISQLGACLRTIIFDEAVLDFIGKNPDSVIVNLDCGLGTNFPRVDNNQILWFDFDLPETIKIRKNFPLRLLVTNLSQSPFWILPGQMKYPKTKNFYHYGESILPKKQTEK